MKKTNPIYNGYFVSYQIARLEEQLKTETQPHRIKCWKQQIKECRAIEKKYYQEIKQEIFA